MQWFFFMWFSPFIGFWRQKRPPRSPCFLSLSRALLEQLLLTLASNGRNGKGVTGLDDLVGLEPAVVDVTLIRHVVSLQEAIFAEPLEHAVAASLDAEFLSYQLGETLNGQSGGSAADRVIEINFVLIGGDLSFGFHSALLLFLQCGSQLDEKIRIGQRLFDDVRVHISAVLANSGQNLGSHPTLENLCSRQLACNDEAVKT